MRNTSIFITAFLLFACSTDEGESPRSIVNGKYSNTATGVSLQFPANWKLETDKNLGGTQVDLVAVGPANQGLSPNVNIIIKPYTGTIDWTQTSTAVKQSLQASFSDFGNYEEAVGEINGVTYGKISYTATVNGNHLKFIQVIIPNKNTATTITFTDHATRFDQNSELLGILASLSIE